MSTAGGRLSLSMRDADQKTGADLSPHLRVKSEEEMQEESRQMAERAASGSNGISLRKTFADDNKTSSARRMTSPERWEIKQMIASGAASAADYPGLDEDFLSNPDGNGFGSYNAGAEADEELDIEINDAEAPFLAGQTKRALELSPVKIVKAPDGGLNRAALAGASLAKERRELKAQEAVEQADSETRDLNTPWLDPMTQSHERTFAADARGVAAGEKAKDVPAWKKETFNQATTFGKITSLSIQDQRKSLPIFKFREQLIEAFKTVRFFLVRICAMERGLISSLAVEPSPRRRRRYGIGQDDADDPVSRRSRVRRQAQDRLHATSSSGRHVGRQARRRGGRLSTGPGGRLHDSIRGLYESRDQDQVHDGWNAPARVLGRSRHDAVQRSHARRGARADDRDRRAVWIAQECVRTFSFARTRADALAAESLKRRPDLKLIVTSATLDAEKFSEYFFSCPIFTIPGRTYPVEVLYTKEPESDYLDASLITVMQIHLSEPPGDILLFLTGQEEIDTSCEILYERMKSLGPNVPDLLILPIYSALPSEMQSKIFDPAPPGARKVIIATNIAETSLTIDGIYYVVDPGFVKQNAYDPRLGMDSLIVTPISQAQARQRSGRAGRTGPGKCYRLYTEAAYRNEMLPNPIPDIQRQNLASTILALKAMGINDLLNFNFMDPPPQQTMITALENLYALSALDEEGLLTRRESPLPLLFVLPAHDY